tara:strand:- start:7059 stop:8858 length:1800 start_codon:yes stop_codon:yes gene_type:complete
MNPGRLWRTVRHLTAEQWVFRFICRGRRLVMRHHPMFSRRRIERAAQRLPLPDPSSGAARDIAGIVLQLQMAVHGDSFDGAPDGRFTLLNRDYDFGGIDGVSWRGEFHEGNNPLRRMNLAYMGYAVPLLARGRAEDLAAMHRLLDSLDVQNDWSLPGVFRDVWNAYTASHRLINLLSGLALYRRAGGPPDPAAETAILGHVRFCAAFVRGNLERDLQFNHLMKNYVALSAYAGACAESAPAFAVLKNAVPKSIRQNILADGGQAERCPMYHVLSMLDIRILAASRLFAETWQPELDGTVARMAAALPVMTLADGEIALMNDSWIGEAPRAGSVVDLSDIAPVERIPETGYVRLGQGGDSVVFDCGPCGPDDNPGHAHADFLTVEATAAGKRFLVDTGVPTYTAGQDRDASRSSAAHNGPRLTGAEPIEFWKSFRVGRRGYAGELDLCPLDVAPLFAAGWQSGYAHLGADLRRVICLWPGEGLLVADLWRGGAGGAATSFLIPSDWTAETGHRYSQAGTRLTVQALAGALSAPTAAAYWYRFGVERRAHRIDVVPATTDGQARAAVFFAWSENAQVPRQAFVSQLFENLAAAIPRQAELV